MDEDDAELASEELEGTFRSWSEVLTKTGG